MLIIAFLFAALNLTSSAPVLPPTADCDVTTTVPLVIFGRELPDGINIAHYRTIQDITWSCLGTIFACAWVAIHPNVPRQEDSGWLRLKQRVVTMIYAILAPEFIIMWALRQRIGAVSHMREYNSKFYRLVTPPSRSTWWYIKHWFRKTEEDGEPDELWTITHGFLLEMRGIGHGNGNIVENMIEIPHALDIQEDEISDKSKGDFLTKFLVLLQTTWFIFQCLGRWILHLPVTELEVVTLAFALLNIGTYALWWHKPQNVIVAIRMDRYQKQKDVPKKNEGTSRREGDMGIYTRGRSSSGEERPEMSSAHKREPVSRGGPVQSIPEDQPRQWLSFLIQITTAAKGCINFVLYALAAIVGAVWWLVEILVEPLLGMAVENSPKPRSAYSRLFYTSKRTLREVSICFSVVATLFGGIHLVPLWSSSFPSPFERLLWQSSAIFITATPLIAACLTLLADTIFSMYLAGRVWRKLWPWILQRSLILLGEGIMGVYLIARIVLIILSFTTLRELPPDIFRNIGWTTFIPHF